MMCKSWVYELWMALQTARSLVMVEKRRCSRMLQCWLSRSNSAPGWTTSCDALGVVKCGDPWKLTSFLLELCLLDELDCVHFAAEYVSQLRILYATFRLQRFECVAGSQTILSMSKGAGTIPAPSSRRRFSRVLRTVRSRACLTTDSSPGESVRQYCSSFHNLCTYTQAPVRVGGVNGTPIRPSQSPPSTRRLASAHESAASTNRGMVRSTFAGTGLCDKTSFTTGCCCNCGRGSVMGNVQCRAKAHSPTSCVRRP